MADRVLLSVPAKGEYARTVRLTAASLATRAGMTFEDVEDIRVAVEEAFVFVCDRAEDGAQIDIAFEVDESGVAVDVGPVAASALEDEDALQRAEYARFILEAVCDELDMPSEAGQCRIRLVKKVGSEAAGA